MAPGFKSRDAQSAPAPLVTSNRRVQPVYFRKSLDDLKGQITKEINPLPSGFVVDVHVESGRCPPVKAGRTSLMLCQLRPQVRK